jgi:hypothetical protein
MTAIDDLIGQVIGNTGNGSEHEEQKPHTANNVDNGKDKRKKGKHNQNLEVQSIQKTKRQQVAYKYSNKGKRILYEAVVIAGHPVFLKYENGEFITVEHIEESSRIIKPPYLEEYPYESYEFANMDEVKEYAEQAKSMSIGSLYTQVMQFVADYNDQDTCKLNLCR